MKVHKGDMVLVISGPDKGAKGKVIAAFPKTEKVLVEGVNRIKKHVANSAPERGAESGGIVTQEAPIHVSNVMVIDADGNPTRVGFRVDENGKKVRVSRRSGKDIYWLRTTPRVSSPATRTRSAPTCRPSSSSRTSCRSRASPRLS